MSKSSIFTTIDEHFGYGEDAPTGWLPITGANLLILVGVTGVGKSTTLTNLRQTGLSFTLMPNRRLLTDHLMIRWLQEQEGLPHKPVLDRKVRFDYTRRYREIFPGGMAHALTQLWVAPEIGSGLLIFDGLRGVNEVTHAARQLPSARFVALNAPDGIRIQRLLGRNDQFDQIDNAQTRHNQPNRKGATTTQGTNKQSLQNSHNNESNLISEQYPAATNLQLTADDAFALMTLVKNGEIAANDLEAKLMIVSEERLNYDPDATLQALQTIADKRLCSIDTVQLSPDQSATQIAAWMKQ